MRFQIAKRSIATNLASTPAKLTFMPTGADLFVSSLKTLGIREIFTLVGDHLNEVLAVAARSGIRLIDMRHESGVTHAADAWARIHRRPAVSLVTGGPGHTNSLTGIATAQLAGSPLIAVSGSRSSLLAERQAFQDIEQLSMTRSMTKWAAEVPAASQVPFYLGRSYAEAISGRMGAVHLTIPVNVFAAEASTISHVPVPPSAVSEPPATDVDRILAALRSAERPIVIAGSGVWWSGAGDELRKFIERTALPLFTITMARGIVPDDHPLCLGFADPAMNPPVQKAFRQADLVLVLGKRIDYRLALGGSRLFSPEAKFIQIDLHPQELGMNRTLDVAICADLKATLGALLNSMPQNPPPARPWLDQLRQWHTEWRQKLAAIAGDSGSPLHPAAFYAELRKVLPRETMLAWDGGDFTHWGRASIPAYNPGGWLRLGPLATIGSALPNSIAMKMAYPDKPVVMITGDGSLGFYIAELDTAVRYKLPIVIIVGNDAGWGLERELQSALTLAGGDKSVACELRATRYDLVMQGFGGGGETVDRIEQVRPAFERALAAGSPYLMNVNIRGTRSPFTDWQIAGKSPAR